MPREEYEELLDSTKNLGDINEMGEDDVVHNAGSEKDTELKFDNLLKFLRSASSDQIMALEREFTEPQPDEIEEWRETLFRMADEDEDVLDAMLAAIKNMSNTEPIKTDEKCKKKRHPKETNEELSPSPVDRAEGFVNADDLNHLKSQIRRIGEDLKDEGFDAVTVKELVINAADEALLGLDDEEI